ncbi:MAG: HlyC/CorC family transporter [Candidatus Dadabacteria bacterium]|nr:MAG: HlyC/CorC family transporter [Candidatus Dadabacteria bacterium]
MDSYLRRLAAKHIMVPRDRIDYLALDRPLEENLTIVRRTRHSRYPLCEKGFDEVLGFVHIKDLLPRIGTLSTSDDLSLVAQAPVFVPETQPLDSLLKKFQRERTRMAVVVDEHGVPTGLLTLDDILESLLGDLRDETSPAPEPAVVATDRGVEVDGMVLVAELCSRLGIPPVTGSAETIGGYVCELLGRIPRAGERFRFADREGEVLEMRGRRVARVLLHGGQHPRAQPAPVSDRRRSIRQS